MSHLRTKSKWKSSSPSFAWFCCRFLAVRTPVSLWTVASYPNWDISWTYYHMPKYPINKSFFLKPTLCPYQYNSSALVRSSDQWCSHNQRQCKLLENRKLSMWKWGGTYSSVGNLYWIINFIGNKIPKNIYIFSALNKIQMVTRGYLKMIKGLELLSYWGWVTWRF